MSWLIKNKQSVLIVGEAGTAKTATIKQYLNSLSSGGIGAKDGGDTTSSIQSSARRQITFSAATTPLIFQRFVLTPSIIRCKSELIILYFTDLLNQILRRDKHARTVL